MAGDHSDNTFDADTDLEDLKHEEPVVRTIENATGRNATYLEKRKVPFDQKKLETIVTLKKGGEYDNPLAETLSKGLADNEEVQLTQENLEHLTKFSTKMKDGYQAAIPQVCMVDACAYKNRCPLLQQGIRPKLMDDCPVETYLFNTWVESKYRELEIDPDSDDYGVDRSQAREYAELELLQYRAALEMAENPMTVVEKAIGVSDSGEAIMTEIENPRISIINNLSKTKSRILDDLVATRKSRIKTGGKTEDAGTAIGNFASKARDRQLKIEKDRQDRANKELEEKTVDAEIID